MAPSTYGQRMILHYKYFSCTRIRLYNLCSLFFFALVHLTSCRQGSSSGIEIIWEKTTPVAISVPLQLLHGIAKNSTAAAMHVRIEKSPYQMLGNVELHESTAVFKPLIPLTPGVNYQIFLGDCLIVKIKIPLPDPASGPVVSSIYPTADTLPENLLKVYLQFSQPMREGESAKFLHLLNQAGDTLPSVFLDLKPELWNKERTVLTMWLDPGRIKRQLIPNQSLGNPLKKDGHYKLAISASWKDARGLPLKQPAFKAFVVGARDSSSPDLQKWALHVPQAGSRQPLIIHFGEPLDYFLSQETIRIVDENNEVAGKAEARYKETQLVFHPEKPWPAGRYRLQVAAELEDLAGNNLQRPFERDVSKKGSEPVKPLLERSFEIKK
jgi:hypothetical protein